jgi:hypothetical protein
MYIHVHVILCTCVTHIIYRVYFRGVLSSPPPPLEIGFPHNYLIRAPPPPPPRSLVLCVCPSERNPEINPNVNHIICTGCYGIVTPPTGLWFCRKCESQERAARVVSFLKFVFQFVYQRCIICY